MKLETIVMDEAIDVKKQDIVTFEKGLYGFENVREYVILDSSPDASNPFLWFHAVEEKLCFVILDPRHVKSDYDFELEDDIMNYLEAEESSEFLMYCLVVIPEDIKEMTINLKSPIIINKENNKAIQLILDDESFEIKHKIISEIMKGA